MTAHCPAPQPAGYGPLPCHTGHPAASSTHDTAFTGTEISGASIALVLVLLIAALVFTLRKLVA